MSEQLLLRLASQAEQAVPWLIWSDSEQEVIASGEVSDAHALTQLTQQAASRRVVVLIPACDVTFHRVELPKSAQRSWQQVAPFMLEEQLAEEPEDLHIVLLQKHKHTVELACVSHTQMQAWDEQLSNANIISSTWLIDALCLPKPPSAQISAIQLEQQWLLRLDTGAGLCVEADWLDLALQPLSQMTTHSDDADAEPADEDENEKDGENQAKQNQAIILNHFSPKPTTTKLKIEWQAQPFELPLKLLAEGIKENPLNLLQGEYQTSNPIAKYWKIWRKVAIAAAISFVLVLANQALQWQQLEQQNQQLTQSIHQVYKKVFPQVKRIRDSRIKKDFREALKGLEQPDQHGFLSLLLQVAPAFQKVDEFTPQSLRYDDKKQELRIQVEASNYQSYEQFKEHLSPLQAEQGTLSKKDNKVVGTITIRSQS